MSRQRKRTATKHAEQVSPLGVASIRAALEVTLQGYLTEFPSTAFERGHLAAVVEFAKVAEVNRTLVAAAEAILVSTAPTPVQG